MLQNMFDLTLSQALGFSNKKEADIATSSKLNKVVFHLLSLKFLDCHVLQNEIKTLPAEALYRISVFSVLVVVSLALANQLPLPRSAESKSVL